MKHQRGLAAVLCLILCLTPALPALANSTLSIQYVTANYETAQTNTAVTWTISASGGVGKYSYCFYLLKDGETVFTGVYDSSNRFTYICTTPGYYQAMGFVKDASGTRVSLAGDVVTIEDSGDTVYADPYIDQPYTGGITVNSLRGYSGGYQYVSFGSYYYTAGGGFKDILWRVLAVNGSEVTLLSEYVLDRHPFYWYPIDVEEILDDFPNSEMYRFLNNDFMYTAFDQSQIAALSYTRRGKVFLPSCPDLRNPNYGFSKVWEESDPNRVAPGTPYAQSLDHNESSSNSTYFTRSPSGKSLYAVSTGGKIMQAREERTDVGVRPMIILNMDMYTFTWGSGTYNDPFM